jgi:penicillin-binding protein 2
VNTYYFKLALDLGIDRIDGFFERFGFGQPTGIDLRGEISGVRPSREWKRRTLGQEWYPGDTVNIGIGQGYWVTSPLQMVRATGALASGGVLRQPHLLRETQAGFDLPRVPEPRPPGVQVVPDDANLLAVRDGMIASLHGPTGSARAAVIGAPYLIAGKTGTAQRTSRKGLERMDPKLLPYHLRHQAWFIAFAPAENPTLALAVLVEHGGSGSGAAAPVARSIFDAWLVPPPEDTAK